MYRACMRDVIVADMIVTVHIYGMDSRAEESSSRPNKWTGLTVYAVTRPGHQYFIPVRWWRRFFSALPVRFGALHSIFATDACCDRCIYDAFTRSRMTTHKTNALPREAILFFLLYIVRHSLTTFLGQVFDSNRITESDLIHSIAARSRAVSNFRANRLTGYRKLAQMMKTRNVFEIRASTLSRIFLALSGVLRSCESLESWYIQSNKNAHIRGDCVYQAL